MEEHSHCHICGRMIEVGNDLCERTECKEKHEEAQAMKKRGMWMFIALIVASVILINIL